jgi:hypothetical protein
LNFILPNGGWLHTTYEVSVLDSTQWVGEYTSSGEHYFATWVAVDP